MNLDRFDKSILAELQHDGRISNVQLAAKVNLSESACLRRVRALEESGLIERFAALLDQKAVGLAGTVFVHIALRREEQSELAAFEKAVRDIPGGDGVLPDDRRIRLPVACRGVGHGRLRTSAQRGADAIARSRQGEFQRRDQDGDQDDRVTAGIKEKKGQEKRGQSTFSKAAGD